MNAIRRSDERGHADHGWLDSRHTFSFAGYWDPRFMGFGALRVINQDVVQPGGGFPTHPHRDMEIVSYVVSGALEHRDTLGSGSVIRPGEVQLMRAGRGIAHSEYNHSRSEPVEFLQIWIQPAERGTAPGYQQRDFGLDPGVQLVASPDGRDRSLQIGQDVDLWRALLPAGASEEVTLRGTRAWVQVIRGAVSIGDAALLPGDGLALVDASTLSLRVGDAPLETLVFDLS